MDSAQKNMPVIVLMDKECSGDQAMIRQWFEDSRFSTCEASNVFEALEHLSDFTLSKRPDVVLLDVDCCDDELPLVREVSDLPVMAVSGNTADRSKKAGKFYNSNFGQLVSRLNELIPQ